MFAAVQPAVQPHIGIIAIHIYRIQYTLVLVYTYRGIISINTKYRYLYDTYVWHHVNTYIWYMYTHSIYKCHIDSYIQCINMQIEVRNSLWKYEIHSWVSNMENDINICYLSHEELLRSRDLNIIPYFGEKVIRKGKTLAP